MVLPQHILRYTISLFVNNALILRSVTIMFASWEHEYTLVYYTIEKKIKHCVTIYRHYIFWCISNTDGRGYSMTAYSTFRRDGFGLLEEKKHQLLKSESYVELVLILFSRWQSAAAPQCSPSGRERDYSLQQWRPRGSRAIARIDIIIVDGPSRRFSGVYDAWGWWPDHEDRPFYV